MGAKIDPLQQLLAAFQTNVSATKEQTAVSHGLQENIGTIQLCLKGHREHIGELGARDAFVLASGDMNVATAIVRLWLHGM